MTTDKKKCTLTAKSYIIHSKNCVFTQKYCKYANRYETLTQTQTWVAVHVFAWQVGFACPVCVSVVAGPKEPGDMIPISQNKEKYT